MRRDAARRFGAVPHEKEGALACRSPLVGDPAALERRSPTSGLLQKVARGLRQAALWQRANEADAARRFGAAPPGKEGGLAGRSPLVGDPAALERRSPTSGLLQKVARGLRQAALWQRANEAGRSAAVWSRPPRERRRPSL